MSDGEGVPVAPCPNVFRTQIGGRRAAGGVAERLKD